MAAAARSPLRSRPLLHTAADARETKIEGGWGIRSPLGSTRGGPNGRGACTSRSGRRPQRRADKKPRSRSKCAPPRPMHRVRRITPGSATGVIRPTPASTSPEITPPLTPPHSGEGDDVAVCGCIQGTRRRCVNAVGITDRGNLPNTTHAPPQHHNSALACRTISVAAG